MNLPSLISALVSAPFTALAGALAPHASPAAAPVVAAAAAQPSEASLLAAVEAVFDPMVKTAVAGLADDIPILGPIFSGEAQVLAVSAEHAALAYLIAKLQGYLPAL